MCRNRAAHPVAGSPGLLPIPTSRSGRQAQGGSAIGRQIRAGRFPSRKITEFTSSNTPCARLWRQGRRCRP